jgi:hypothetical protein
MSDKKMSAADKDRMIGELQATIDLLRAQLGGEIPEFKAGSEDDTGETRFSPTDEADESDVGELTARVAEAAAHRTRAAAKYAGSAELHQIDHGHDTAADVETDAEDRETEVIEWQDPSNLEAPPARPGFVQRWIRASFRTGEDPGNLLRARREGWRPRLLKTVGKDYAPATVLHKTLGEVIAVEGLILCEMPINVARARYRYYRRLLEAQNEAIRRDVHKDERPGMPIIADRRSTVTRGRRPEAGD